MTTLSWPLLSRAAPGSLDWSLAANTVSFQSPLAGSVQTVEFPGARWKVSFVLESLTESDAALLQAMLVQMRGRAGRLSLHNFARPQPRGTLRGSPLVKGAGQIGTSLLIDGCAVGATLLAGDFIAVNGELKMVVAAATANAGGEMSVSFEPPLRAAPADNAAVTWDKPTATFMLSGDEMKWTTRAGLISSFPVDLIEAWS